MSHYTPEEKVKIARDPGRPGTADFISALFTDFFEQRGDRQCREEGSILGGIARFHGRTVTVIGHRKRPEGYRKAQRLMRQAEKFGRPIITFVDTPGAYPGKEAEERGQGEAIAQCLALMSSLTVPVISIITGEGGSGGALALAVANRVLMLEHAVYSVLSPEGFASILWKDASRSGEACAVMKLTAQDLRRGGIVQGVLKEPEGGAHTDWEATFHTMDAALRKELAALDKLKGPALARQRYEMFRAMGQGLPPAREEEP